MLARRGYSPLAMYYFVLVAVAGLVAGTIFISSEKEGILKPVPPPVDLGEEMKVIGVTVTNNCCFPWFGNFSVHVGSRMLGIYNLNDYKTCLLYTGILQHGAVLSLVCKTHVTGRYLRVESQCEDKTGHSAALFPCKLEVISVKAVAPYKKTAVFAAGRSTSAEENEEMDCARQCMHDEFCVRFDLSPLQECQLYDTRLDGTPESYSLHKIIF